MHINDSCMTLGHEEEKKEVGIRKMSRTKCLDLWDKLDCIWKLIWEGGVEDKKEEDNWLWDFLEKEREAKIEHVATGSTLRMW